MNALAKLRAMVACCLLATVFTGFSVRLVHLQVTKHDEYAALAAENHGMHQITYARRGAILDSIGEPLAQNQPVRTVVVDGSLVTDRDALAAFLAKPLGIEKSVLLEKLRREHWSNEDQDNVPDRYIVLKKEVPEIEMEALTELIAEQNAGIAAKHKEQAEAARAAKLAGMMVSKEPEKPLDPGFRSIIFEQGSVRLYPNGEMLCHVIGLTDGKNQGIDGVEKSMNAYLQGQNGVRYSERDSSGKELVPYRGQERPARDGCNVRLTIDLSLQNIVETELNDAVKQYRPKMAVAIIMRPQTGEILALANRPNFDLNDVEKSPMEARRNRAISDMFEPGSVFKIVTFSGALNQKLVHPDTMIPTENGYFNFMGKILKDTHPFPELSVHDGLVHSSNICAAKLGIQLGEQKLYEYVRRFGFGDRTGVQLPGETSGLVHPVYHWSKLSISRIPMGQEVCVTPLQMCTAMCVIANGGTLYMPQIIHDVTDHDGNTVATFPPAKVLNVISPAVAAEVRAALIDVCGKKGTGKGIWVPGFNIGGKTGTAQKALPNGGGYEKDKYILSFAGFLPAENPQFVCLVTLDDCVVEKHLNYGGSVAGPIFAKIAERAARHLGLEPSQELLQQQKTQAQIAEHGND